MNRFSAHSHLVWFIIFGMLLFGCQQNDQGEVVRRYLSEIGYSSEDTGQDKTIVLIPLKTCSSCMLVYQDLIPRFPDHHFIISTSNRKKAQILFPADTHPNVWIDAQNKAVDEYEWVSDYPRLITFSEAGNQVTISDDLKSIEIENELRKTASKEPYRLKATFRVLDTIDIEFAEPRFNLGKLQKNGSYLFFSSVRFFPELNQHGHELNFLHLPSGTVRAIGRTDLGDRAPTESFFAFTRSGDQLFLMGTTHIFEFSLKDQSRLNQIRPLFEGDLEAGRTSFFFQRLEASEKWLCPVGLGNVHGYSLEFFSAAQPVIGILNQNMEMEGGIGEFPEHFRQGFFLHPPSFFVADVFRKELYLLFNSQKEIQVFNLAGEEKIRTLDLPESQWLDYRLKYVEGEFESSQDAMMALAQDLETRRAYANEYYQGIKVDSERIRMMGTGIKDIGKLNFVPHNFIFDYYPERNAYTRSEVIWE